MEIALAAISKDGDYIPGRRSLQVLNEEFGIYKNNAEYYKKEELDKMLSGEAHIDQ